MSDPFGPLIGSQGESLGFMVPPLHVAAAYVAGTDLKGLQAAAMVSEFMRPFVKNTSVYVYIDICFL